MCPCGHLAGLRTYEFLSHDKCTRLCAGNHVATRQSSGRYTGTELLEGRGAAKGACGEGHSVLWDVDTTTSSQLRAVTEQRELEVLEKGT